MVQILLRLLLWSVGTGQGGQRARSGGARGGGGGRDGLRARALAQAARAADAAAARRLPGAAPVQRGAGGAGAAAAAGRGWWQEMNCGVRVAAATDGAVRRGGRDTPSRLVYVVRTKLAARAPVTVPRV